MLRFGFVRILAILLVGIAIPFALYQVSRRIALPVLIAVAVGLGLAYGAIKADGPWSGDGLFQNLQLMSVSAAALAAYVWLSVVVARQIAKRL